MEWLLIAVATCLLASCPVKGDDWRWEYEEGLRHYSEEALKKEYPEKTRPANFKHPLFRCPDMSASISIPNSIEMVKAADIKVIAALGDSLTTAIGANATTVLGIPIEFRHVSWSNLPGQTRHLIDTLKTYEGVNFDEDWKLLTILIGMNDICDYCKDKSLFSVENFVHYMTVSLEMLMNEVPRMIVNVVQILPMETLREVQKPTPGCLLQRSFCSCLVKPATGSADLKELIEINLQFQNALEQLLYSNRFFKSDFAVILQPFLKFADPPRHPDGKIDMSFFTPDCFHFTMKGHEELAKGLWNNMFQPEGEKLMVESFSTPIQLMCPPVDHPYIYTKPNAVKIGQSPQPSPPASGGLHLATVLSPMTALAFLLFWWASSMASL
ncbi:phospholipase B1, membrane-associated [Salminus brasiliensis]|uniref:phospholipase B1, membrane-associated n=1 Tax=Salminus brasiliensis TaxID=930266 RepID=UPI003B82DA8D